MGERGVNVRYITVEQFREQPENIQKVLVDWWEPQMYDLFVASVGELGDIESCIGDKHTSHVVQRSKGENRLPLFTLQQLWEFIEDKVNCFVTVDFIADEYWINTDDWWNKDEKCFFDEDKLQAFWKCACEVARVIKE